MAEKELNLLQLASVDVTQLCTCPPQVVRCEMIKLHPLGTVPNHIPDHGFRDSFAPCASVPADCPEDSTVRDIRRYPPSVDCALNPDRHWNRADMAALTDEIDDCPVSLSDLDVLFPKGYQFCSSNSASEQAGDHCYVTDTTEALAIRSLKEQASLIAVEPVADPRAQLLHAFHSSDSGRQFWAQ